MKISDKIIRRTKITRGGHRGMYIYLPKRFIVKKGFDFGDEVEIYEIGDSLLIKFVRK